MEPDPPANKPIYGELTEHPALYHSEQHCELDVNGTCHSSMWHLQSTPGGGERVFRATAVRFLLRQPLPGPAVHLTQWKHRDPVLTHPLSGCKHGVPYNTRGQVSFLMA